MTREEFLQRRKSGIGGSDVAAVLGLSPWRSPLDVFEDKTDDAALREFKESKPTGETRALYWGAALEGEIAKAYTITTGRKVMRYTRILRHPDYEYIVGDVDRLVYCEDGGRPFKANTGEIVTDRGLEIKTSRFKSEEWGDDGSDNIPVPYYCQVQWYMALAPSVRVFDVAVLFGGSDFQIFTVPRNDELIGKLIAKVAEFWQTYIVTRTAPPPRTFEEVKRLHPAANIPKITASVELEKLVRDLAAATARRKADEAAESGLKFQVAAQMGGAELAELPDGTPLCTFKNSKNDDRRLTVKIK